MFTEQVPTDELATVQLEELKVAMEPEEFDRAAAVGTAKPHGVAVEELLMRPLVDARYA